MIDYKQEDNFKMRFFIDIALCDQNEKLDENDEYDENDDNEDLFFDYDIYESLETYGEKMRYISNYYSISYDDFKKISPTIINDLKNGFKDDLKNTLSAIRILLKNDFPLQFDESISIEIINIIDYEILFKDIQYIILNYIFNNIDKISSNIMDLFNSKIFDKVLCTNAQILKLAAKLIRIHNYQYPLDLFDEIFGKYETMAFKEKNRYSN